MTEWKLYQIGKQTEKRKWLISYRGTPHEEIILDLFTLTHCMQHIVLDNIVSY